MKFDTEIFLKKPWRVFLAALAFGVIAAFVREPEIANWDVKVLLGSFLLPLIAGVIGYVVLKRRANQNVD